MRISDWSSDVCSSDLHGKLFILLALARQAGEGAFAVDVFGDQHLNRDASGRGDREIFLGNVSRWLGTPETVTVLQRSSLEVRPEDILAATGPVRLASVDGGHTEVFVVIDLHQIDRASCQARFCQSV